jgi:hypothetical protein
MLRRRGRIWPPDLQSIFFDLSMAARAVRRQGAFDSMPPKKQQRSIGRAPALAGPCLGCGRRLLGPMVARRASEG